MALLEEIEREIDEMVDGMTEEELADAYNDLSAWYKICCDRALKRINETFAQNERRACNV
jgi:hypothetical protein